MEAKTTRAKPSTEKQKSSTNNNKESSEVVWGPFVSASSSRLTLARPALAASLAGAARDLRLGSGLTANRINLPYASELYPAFNISSRFSSTSVLPLTLAYPPSQSCDQESDSLEPRTPHQPEKLKKLSKNDPVVLLL